MLAVKSTRRPLERTTRSPLIALPGVRPPPSVSKPTSKSSSVSPIAGTRTSAPSAPKRPSRNTSSTPTASPLNRRSRPPATARDPNPASVSSSATPSGVGMVMRSSYCTHMKVERFIGEREGDWRELDELLRAGGRRRRGAADVLRLGALYRGAAADLALARRGHPGDPIVARLESLVARARQAVYAEEPRRGSLRTFFARTYWVRVRERPLALLIALALLFVPAGLTVAWALSDTGAVLTNNIRVTFLAFAAGILFGLGTAVVVAYNGAVLGAVAGGAIANGNGAEFAEFVTAHGVIELSCIAVAATAGMRMGYAIVAPGPRRRSRALAEEARSSIVIVLGTIPWVILAGIIEGFVTRAGFGLVPGIVLGVGVGAVYWTLVVVRGRPQRRPRTPAAAALTAAPAP